MEGVVSRLGRSSSRYGPSATASAFNGPVRKWKRKWVHVSPSTTVNHHNSNSRRNGHNTNTNTNNSRLLLCRWTPLSAATAADASSEEPPRRKFRYTPIAVVEERRKAAKAEPSGASKNDELNGDKGSKKETQNSNTDHLDLGLFLKGHNDDHDSVDQRKDDQMKKTSSGGFWTIG